MFSLLCHHIYENLTLFSCLMDFTSDRRQTYFIGQGLSRLGLHLFISSVNNYKCPAAHNVLTFHVLAVNTSLAIFNFCISVAAFFDSTLVSQPRTRTLYSQATSGMFHLKFESSCFEFR